MLPCNQDLYNLQVKGVKNQMIKLKLGNITVTSLGDSSGFFIGETNTHKNFCSNKVITDIVGDISGKENTVINNKWVKDNLEWKEE